MKVFKSRTAGRVLAGLAPLALLAAALPLLGPTCGGFAPGSKTFSRGSLIIPMDVCYQCSTDQDSGTSPSACGQTSYVTPTGNGLTGGIACTQATDPGDVVKAYGLVYQLIRNGVPVYWIIDPAKSSLDGIDLNVTYSGGPPVQRYDWNTGGSGTAPTSGTSVRYMGGPFIIDGSDFAKASAVMQANKATFSSVKVHMANVAFTAPVARTMAGGWTAGGSVPPKLAMLDIGSSGAGTKNSEVVIRGYLIKAGLDFVGAGGTSAAGQHGQIYDRLTMADFQPDASGDWKTTNLYKNGYQILWVPHWAAPSSCSDCTTSASTGSGTCPTTTCSCSVKYTATEIANSLKTIGAFFAAEHDVFAECAGLGSFEGVYSGSDPSTTVNATYGSGDPTTHFQTTATTTPGVWINASVSTSAIFQPGNFASPFLQIGDFVFRPYGGAVQNYDPTAYTTEVKRFVTEPNSSQKYDIFTIVPAVASGHGTSVYMGGHSYSGCDGTFQTAGTRLVLNSLFNLGASCVASGVACSTGYLGACAQGTMTCDTNGNQVCTPTVLPNQLPETCNGVDDNCNGLVDEGLTSGCYDGPGPTRNVGLCHDGVRSCEKQPDGTYAMGACVGEQLPATEVCNGLDDDCDGQVDEGLGQACYTGPTNTLDINGVPMGTCKAGTQTCSNGSWGTCAGQVLPIAEFCGGDGTGDGLDNNCNGVIDEGCGCSNGATKPCYAGPAGTQNVGACKGGTQTCSNLTWGPCVGQVLPGALDCTKPPATPPADDNCNGVADYLEAACNVCPSTLPSCYEGPAGTSGVGVCKDGVRSCSNGVFGACTQQILPSPELCDGKDNNCNGQADEGPPPCGAGFSCVNGVCVFSSCGPEVPCPEGYACSSGACVLANCGAAPCSAGFRCIGGTCVDPCVNVKCGAGDVCAGGICTGGSCYSSGCGTGLVCQNGACVSDRCANVVCPSGTFCRDGDCVQSCTWVSCPGGQRCGSDGFCVTDPCAGVSCQSGYTCNSTGTCVKDPCANLLCGAGQYCDGGVCVDDPCANVTCQVGACWRGQCYPSSNPKGLATAVVEETKKAAGCGCGGDTGSPWILLLGLAALPFARRRRSQPRAAGLLTLALVVGLSGLVAGCPKPKKPVDLSGCTETCGEQRCVDVRTDAAHCGQCAIACVAGEICVDSACGPGSAIAPYVSALNPSSAAKGTTIPVPVQVTGQRFQSGAKLRIIRASGWTEVATTFTDAQHVQASIDVSTDPTSTLYLRVVNPDKVVSNAPAFQIVPATPNVTAWTITIGTATSSTLAIPAGKVGILHAAGTGLTSASLCHIQSATFSDHALPTTPTATGIDCTLDTAGVPPGGYQLWVVNEGTYSSTKTTLTVTSETPTLSSLSPSSAKAGTIFDLTVYGGGFDPTSKVNIDGVAQGTTYVDPTTLIVSQLNTTSWADGNHPVVVKNGTVSSGPLNFLIETNPPSVTGLSPQTAYQGQSLTVTFTGTNIPSNAVIQVRKPDTTVVALTPTTVTGGTSASATLALTPTSSWPAGSYQLYLSFPTTGTASGSFPFTALSNVAVLNSATPAGKDQGSTNVTIALTGSNFFNGMKVYLRGAGLGPSGGDINLDISPTSVTSTSATTVAFSLAGFNTGLYTIVAVNTGAADSNTLAFSVTPGVPTITTVSPASIPQSTQCATPSPTPTPVALTGTNFAKPDANGNGGSQVVTWNTGLSIPVTVLPSTAVQVVNSTTINVSVDTCQAIPSTTYPYTVQVWNPGGVTPPQKSNSDKTLTITP